MMSRMASGLDPRWKELSDHLIDLDPHTLEQRPIRVDHVREALLDEGNLRAVEILASLPTNGEYLDRAEIDAVFVRAHHEIYRMAKALGVYPWVERELSTLIAPWLSGRGLRIVDVGCGIASLLRTLRPRFSPNVELIGCDRHRALIDEASRLSSELELPVDLHWADAFELDLQADVFVSSGLLHHLSPSDLVSLFRRQRALGARGFFHIDIRPSLLMPLGSRGMHTWFMREPMARHDGILSSLRAHPPERLLEAVHTATGTPGHIVKMPGPWPLPSSVHAIVWQASDG